MTSSVVQSDGFNDDGGDVVGDRWSCSVDGNGTWFFIIESWIIWDGVEDDEGSSWSWLFLIDIGSPVWLFVTIIFGDFEAGPDGVLLCTDVLLLVGCPKVFLGPDGLEPFWSEIINKKLGIINDIIDLGS